MGFSDYRKLNLVEQFDADDVLNDLYYKPEVWLRNAHTIKTAEILMHNGIICTKCYLYKHEC